MKNNTLEAKLHLLKKLIKVYESCNLGKLEEKFNKPYSTNSMEDAIELFGDAIDVEKYNNTSENYSEYTSITTPYNVSFNLFKSIRINPLTDKELTAFYVHNILPSGFNLVNTSGCAQIVLSEITKEIEPSESFFGRPKVVSKEFKKKKHYVVSNQVKEQVASTFDLLNYVSHPYTNLVECLNSIFKELNLHQGTKKIKTNTIPNNWVGLKILVNCCSPFLEASLNLQKHAIKNNYEELIPFLTSLPLSGRSNLLKLLFKNLKKNNSYPMFDSLDSFRNHFEI